MERMYRAALNSWRGFRSAAVTEAAIRQEIALLAVSIPLAFCIAPENWKRIVLIEMVLLIVVVEIINTAIEKLCDRFTLERDEQIGRVKDMGSAAVSLTLLMAGAVWAIAAFQYAGTFV